MTIGGVRRSQLITTYGIGSIVPVGESAVMVAGIDLWPITQAREISEPRLEKKLGVEKFILPPASGDDNKRDIPVFRFPSWCWCSSCRCLAHYNTLSSDEKGKCNNCSGQLVPSRFVIACDKGHIDDFPFWEWVHAGRSWNEKRAHNLTIEAGGVSTSLSDVIIRCECGLSRNMQGSFSKIAMKGVLSSCSGRRPWLNDHEKCTSLPRTLQRGASNVYFPVTESAISIPPWSEGPLKAIGSYWSVFKYIADESGLHAAIEGWRRDRGIQYETRELVRAITQRRSGEIEAGVTGEESLKLQEYEALVNGHPETLSEADFVCVPASGIPAEFEEIISQVMQVKRLREVVALTGFARLSPFSASDSKDRLAPIYRNKVDWLPAVEVIGEGIFIRLNTDKIKNWEADESVKNRADFINRNYEKKFRDNKQVPDRVITARFVMIHTLAHALITQWSLDCGYPSASLKERLYVSDDMAGLLIYTASTDAAGSLGGVIAQADPGTLTQTLRDAIQNTSWCSGDPLCIEADAAGVDSLNLAACHACALLPEVSCEERNVLLDRGLLAGTQDDPEVGFFSAYIHK